VHFSKLPRNLLRPPRKSTPPAPDLVQIELQRK